MGFKEHLGIKVVSYFINLFKIRDDLRKITNQQIEKLRLGKNDILLKTRFFISFNKKEVNSIIITSDRIIMLPSRNGWQIDETKIIERKDIQFIKMEHGILYASSLRIKKLSDILKVKIIMRNTDSYTLHILIDSLSWGNKIMDVFNSYIDVLSHKVNSLDTTTEGIHENTRSSGNFGTILLWDYDNVKLNGTTSLKDDKIGTRISQELKKYQPILKGTCAYVNPLSRIERDKIYKIEKKIDAYQAKYAKDAADYLLLEKGSKLISQYNPETLIIISGDHIFTNLLKLQNNNDIKLVLFHLGNISNDWLSTGVKLIGINLSKPLIFKCQNSQCTKVYESQIALDQHIHAKHPSKPHKTIVCRYETCNSRFTTEQGMQRHFQVKHTNK